MRQSYEAIIWGNLIFANVFLCFTLLFVKDFRLDFSPSPHPFWWKKAFRSKLKKKNIKKATKNNVEKNLFYFRKWDFLAVILKKFKKQPPELLWHMLKKLLVFQEGTDKARKTKNLLGRNFLSLFTAVKHREIPCDYLYSAVKYR